MTSRLAQTICPALLFVGAAFAAPAHAATLDFEDAQPSTVTDHYLSAGATFNGPRLRNYGPGFTHSGTKAIELCFAIEFCTTPLKVTFNAGQARAKVWVGFSSQLGQAITVLLQALDQNNAVIVQTSAVLGPSAGPIPVQTPLEITSASSSIRTLVVTTAPGASGQAYNNGLVVDNVEFSGGGAGTPPPCAAPLAPTVRVYQPLGNITTSVDLFQLDGLVVSPGPIVEATLLVTSAAGTRTSDLLGTVIQPSGGRFMTQMGGMLTAGTNVVTVRVRNCRGTGSASGEVAFLPIGSSRLKLLGLEVVQATQDLQNSVPLISNKAAIVRVYLGVQGGGTLGGVSGSLVATPPGGQPLGPIHSMNAITVTGSPNVQVRRIDLAASLNFAVPIEWTRGRTLHFALSRIYLNGMDTTLPCDGCNNVDAINAPRYVSFQPTRPINLILAPYMYRDHEPDLLFTPMGALQWMNNVYPLGGNFPIDGSGIRLLRILPMRATTKVLCPACDAGSDFLDELQDTLRLLRLYNSQYNARPSDFHLFAMVPCGACGGRADIDGRVAYGETYNVQDGPLEVSVANPLFEVIGKNWAHEIAHNLGRVHASNAHGESANDNSVDASFPHAHGGIGQPGLAITTNWWQPNAPPLLIPPRDPELAGFHAHDFMSYGHVSDTHSFGWVSPYTYKALFDHLKVTQAQALAPAVPSEKLVVAGRVNADGTVMLRPFERVTTGYSSGAGAQGDFSVELIDAAGRTLLSHRFVALRREGTKSRSFSELMPWRVGTQQIVIRGRGGVLAKRIVSRNAPQVRIISPSGGEAWGRKAIVTWEAADTDGDALTFAVLYSAGDAWLPLASGLTANAVTVDTALLPGSSRARLRVVASDGVNTSTAETARPFAVAGKAPLVAIHRLSNDMRVSARTAIELAGFAYDAEDGVVSDKQLAWTSNVMGHLGTGQRIDRMLATGQHTITLTATDNAGQRNSARVRIRVGGDGSERREQ